ncbi:lipoprotein insertase outer membrane protein LolB [Alishewanella sp. d11]|uniref:lipoprotein insertase outer membrane protein LolB n=1 Tax=Alishewanella sp. d11 TaxID=3414030 RepID=UPI003BF7941B
MPFSYRQLISIVLLLFLTGCSLKPKIPETAASLAPAQREQQLNAMQQFTLQAAMNVKSPAESITGSLRWQQLSAETYQARLANMLGISLFELRQAQGITELQVRGERYQAADPSSLLWQLAGWSIPLHDMALWLRGLPGDTATEQQYDNAGRLVRFTLIDSTGIRWQLSYQSFFNDPLALPRVLQLQSEDTQIRLVIRSWQP